MNTSHNLLAILALCFALLAVNTCAAEKDTVVFSDNDPACVAAKSGALELSKNDNYTPTKNAFLFDCAVAVTVPGPKDTKEMRKEMYQKKVALADQLLMRELDVKFTNQYGNTILMSVVISFLSDDWKTNTVKKLIEKGIDIKHTNQFNKTALDFANQKGNKAIAEILTSNE